MPARRNGARQHGKVKHNLETNLRFCRLSAIVLPELENGAYKRPDLPALRARVARLREIIADGADYTCADATFYGRIRAHLARLRPNAQPIGPYDLMLAAQALRIGAVLFTNNIAEFARVPSLAVEDWQALRSEPNARFGQDLAKMYF